MVTVCVCSKLKRGWKSVVFTNKLWKNPRHFVGVFNKTTIPLALVGYEMIISNPTLRASLAIIYPLIQRTLVEWLLISDVKQSSLLKIVPREPRGLGGALNPNLHLWIFTSVSVSYNYDMSYPIFPRQTVHNLVLNTLVLNYLML